MLIKIIIGELCYIYRGDINIEKIKLYIQTIIKRQFQLKWKDQDDDLISVQQKQDLDYYYMKWINNQQTQNQPFRIYVKEKISLNQDKSQGQIQIFSPYLKKNQKQQSISFHNNDGDFKNINSLHTQFDPQDPLSTVQEESNRNLSDNNLDNYPNRLTIFQSRKNKNKIVQNQDEQQEQSSFLFPSIQRSNTIIVKNIDLNNEISSNESISPQQEQTFEQQQAFSFKKSESQIIEENLTKSQYLTIEKIGDKQLENQKLEILTNIYCDSCSELIDSNKFFICETCEDFHCCQNCFESQENLHFHELLFFKEF